MSKAFLLGAPLVWMLVVGTGGLSLCPEPSLLPPCTCTNFDLPETSCSDVCSLEDLHAMVQRTVDYRLRSMRLLRANVPYLNVSWFAAKRTEELYVSHSTLYNLFAAYQDDAAVPSLERLYVEHTRVLRKVQWGDLRAFVRLRRLSVTDTEVAELRHGFRKGVSALLSGLNLSGSRISSLAGGVLAGKRSLRTIELRHCNISDLSTSFFEDQRDSLAVLDLSYNPIERLPHDLLQGFRSPQLYLWLVGTRLKTLAGSLQSLLSTLPLNLYLEDSPLECFCGMRWVVGHGDRLIGRCHAPPALHSKLLKELTQQDFAAC